MPSLEECLHIGRAIAWGASDILWKYYQSPETLQIKNKSADEGDVTDADIAANEYILSNLYREFGTKDFGYLSEETEDTSDRLNHDWVWAIDPLDGTSDFIKRTGEFSVHIGLSYRQRPVLGLVAVPMANHLYTAIREQGAYLEERNGKKVKIQVSAKTDINSMIAIASRSHRTAELELILSKLPKAQELSVGSIGGKFGAIASGTADYYISVSGTSAPKDWDYCAPEIILTEAGGKLTHFDGTALTYNNPDITQWGNIIASNGHKHLELCNLSQKILDSY
ncbi:3'-phosphoadenosine 5'-phosphosulfate (PAPS) 3'-phosphatase [Synechococcus sp. PCC 7502]|uniref:3'(2'),5'-bisphosphate nucleotidase CysQ family protein n=1 Tax=Synechococcus sp. PCC 7502 TaxID=1173263 RepID=UPI0002A0010D|nr:3'(2'),5'-bisphosphate nucleotidase CysQ [Synechococcus sp. PCC 7502]AFY72299.1 3'-phosphoadenosine 5'-phosphosulfate (PAPS) 3'-phosphatase [Synechococcus sp. PCC 7502]